MITSSTEREPSREPLESTTRPPAELELELLVAAATAVAEGAAVEGVALLLLVGVGVVAHVEAAAELGVGQDLVGLVDGGHLLLGVLLGDPLLGGLVRVVLLGQLAVGALDLALVGIPRHPEHLVVVLGLAPLELDLRLLQQRVDDARFLIGTRLGCLVERPDAGLEVLRVELRFALVDEAVEGVLVQLESLFTICARLLVAGLFGFVSNFVCARNLIGRLTS